MMNIVTVEHLNHPHLQPYLTLRQPEEHRRNGIFVAEGNKVIERLFESNIQILSVLLTPEWLEEYKTTLQARPEQFDVFVGAKSLLHTIVGFHLHQGVMAVAKIPEPETLEQLLARSSKPILFVAVDGLTNSENLGVLVRNCVAFGVQGLLVGETSSSPYLRRSVRNSMGTIFKLPVVQSSNLADDLSALQKHGMKVIAAHPAAREQTLSKTDFSASCCVVFGSEGDGISKKILEVCKDRAAIPMEAGVDSLNVGSASAAVLYEVRRQRKAYL
ncbi:MAG: RNA methyltransferase [Bacteroidota bacterium]